MILILTLIIHNQRHLIFTYNTYINKRTRMKQLKFCRLLYIFIAFAIYTGENCSLTNAICNLILIVIVLFFPKMIHVDRINYLTTFHVSQVLNKILNRHILHKLKPQANQVGISYVLAQFHNHLDITMYNFMLVLHFVLFFYGIGYGFNSNCNQEI